MEKILMTPSEVAAALSIGRGRVYGYLTSGVLPAVRIGRSLRVPADAVAEWVRRQVSPTHDGDVAEMPPGSPGSETQTD